MRKTATMITCDRAGCRVYAEVADPDRDAPEGWFRVTIASPFVTSGGESYRYENKVNSFELCSEACVAKWANDRRKFKAPVTRSSNGSKGENTNAENQIEAVRLALLEAMPDALSVTDIVGFTGIEKSTVGRRVTALVDRGLAVEVEASRGPYPARYALTSGQDGGSDD